MALDETLDLDYGDAIAGVDALGTAFDEVVAGFQSGINESLDSLTQVDPVALEIDADATSVTGSIDEAVAASDLEPALTADASDITSEIDNAVGSADTNVEVAADVPDIGGEIQAELDSVDGNVEIQVDEAGLQELQSGADAASSSLGGLGDAAGQAGAASDLATGSAAGLGSVLAGIGGATGAVVGVFTGLAAATGVFFNKAVEAQGIAKNFQVTLGSFAKEVQTINVGNLTRDLGDLAVELGSDDERLSQAAASIFTLGKASGNAGPEVAKTTEQIVALAARAVAIRPQLGDIGAVADKMALGLARGGKAAFKLGLDLSTAEINNKAFEQTGKTSATQLTQWEKTAAAAAVATEKYGSSLDEVITKGSKNPIVALNRLKVEFENMLEAVGTPLISPVFDLLKAGIPIGAQLATVIGRLAQTVLPVLVSVMRGGGNVVAGFGDAIIGLLNAFAPVLDVIASLPPAVLTTVASFIAFRNATAPILTLLAQIDPQLLSVVLGFISFQRAAAAIGPAMTAVGLATDAALGPIGIIAGLIGAAAVAFGLFGNSADDAGPPVEQLQGELFKLADAAGAAGPPVIDLAKNLSDFIDSNKAGQGIRDFRSELSKLGISQKDLAQAFIEGKTAKDAFNTSMSQNEATAVAIDVGFALRDTHGNLSKAIKESGHTQAEYNEALKTAGPAGKAARDSYIEIRDAVEKTSKATLAQGVALEVVTQKEAASLKNKLGLVAAAGEVTARIEEETRAAAAQAAADKAVTTQQTVLASQLGGTAAGWNVLTAAIGAQGPEYAKTKPFADALGVSIEQLGPIVDAVAASIAAFTDGAVGKLPQIGDAFTAATEKSQIGAEAFKTNLITQLADIGSFTANLQTIISEGFGTVAGVIAQEGPEKGAQIAEEIANGIRNGEPGVALQLAGLLDARKISVEGFTTLMDQLAVTLAAKGDVAGAEAVKALGLQFTAGAGGAVTPGIDAAGAALDKGDLEGPAGRKGDKAGKEVGIRFTRAVGDGVTAGEPVMRDAASGVVGRLNGGLGAIEAGRNVGGNYTAGMAVGILAGAGAVRAAAQAVAGSLSGGLGAHDAGVGVGQSFASGLAAGIRSGGGATGAARELVREIESAARAEAKSKSPSKLFAVLGADLVAGIAVGIKDSSTDAEKALATLVRDLAATKLPTIDVGATVSATGGASSSSGALVNDITIGGTTIEVTVPGASTSAQATELGQAAGQAAGDAFAEISALNIKAAIRAMGAQ